MNDGMLICEDSLPGAVAAYGPAVGISRVSDTLPAPVYALISGLNGATVGIIALAAVQLSGKAITDKLTRLLVLFGGTAGMLYNALWYFPVLTVAGELSTVIWDYRWQQRGVRTVKRSIFGRHQAISGNDEEVVTDSAEMQVASQPSRTSAVVAPDDSTARRIHNPSIQPDVSPQDSSQNNTRADGENSERLPLSHLRFREFSWKLGFAVIALFFVAFIVVMIVCGTNSQRSTWIQPFRQPLSRRHYYLSWWPSRNSAFAKVRRV